MAEGSSKVNEETAKSKENVFDHGDDLKRLLPSVGYALLPRDARFYRGGVGCPSHILFLATGYWLPATFLVGMTR